VARYSSASGTGPSDHPCMIRCRKREAIAKVTLIRELDPSPANEPAQPTLWIHCLCPEEGTVGTAPPETYLILFKINRPPFQSWSVSRGRDTRSCPADWHPSNRNQPKSLYWLWPLPSQPPRLACGGPLLVWQ